MELLLGLQQMSVDKESLKAAHHVILEKFGPVDILINGAGGKSSKRYDNKGIFI